MDKLKTTYSIDEEYLSIKATGFETKFKWKFVSVWRIRGDLLVIQADKLPYFYLPISMLKSKSMYSLVLKKLNKYAKEFK